MLILAKLTFARPDISLEAFYPLVVLGLLMVAALCFELKPEHPQEPGDQDDESSGSSRPMAMSFSALGLIALMISYLARDNGAVQSTFNAMLADDGFSRWAGLLIAGCALLTVLSGQEELSRNKNRHGGEFVALVLGASLGMVLMASALNTIVLFLGLELFSIALYLLCIFFPERASSRESGMKYFLLSSAASAILLYGLALLYGATGTTWISEMTRIPGGLGSTLAQAGTVLVICGLLFKLAVVPFHFWAPDVYEGAPTTVTAFMSVATKVAAIAALWRLFLTNPESSLTVNFILTGLAICSMFLGNLMALAQTSVKRMLAYSGVGNAGYLLIAPAVGTGMEGPMMFFMSTYMVANIGAFLSLSVVEGVLGREVLRTDLRGLFKTHPGLAAVFGLSLVSLAGIPPAGGFLAKFFLFGRAIAAENWWLPAAGIVCSVLGAAYYLSTAISLFDGRAESVVEAAMPTITDETGLESPTSMTSVALVLCAAGILVLGVVPAPFMAWLTGLH
jgi:NADH-quinone oxidoreductase subunit N